MGGNIGIIGIGIMGSAIASNLIKAGFTLAGYDIDPQKLKVFVEMGGKPTSSCQEVAEEASVIITSLPSNHALHEVVSGQKGIATVKKKDLIVIETSTLDLEAKEAACKVLKDIGIEMLDAPLSGTGAQARKKDISVYSSGDKKAHDSCKPVFDGFARSTHYIGEFGTGTKMKLVANLLVTIHNVASAEAFVFGMKSGLDPHLMHKVISDGGGSSRMFEVRGPLMAEGKYDEPTMKMELHQKDIRIISSFAEKIKCPTPLLSASAQFYTAALAQGRAKEDTGAVCAILEQIAGIKRG
ncbi:MAG: NAD(P)-dependent oxidoreductase [Spirochaetes bacterium]|nr:MAG: NAD(P)-dependent oxidoreductase [Spirochaetota bacterium]